MSVSRPARCLFTGPSLPRIRPRVRCRNFHPSPTFNQNRKPKSPSIKQFEIEEQQRQAIRERAKENFKPYSAEEKAVLAAKYTPEQIAAIEAGEAAIDPEDLEEKGVIRTDWGSLEYLDDFSKMRPMVDRNYDASPVGKPRDPMERLMTWKEMDKHAYEYDEKVEKLFPEPKDFDFEDPKEVAKLRPNRVDVFRNEQEVPFAVNSKGPVVPAYYLAPSIPIDIESQLDETELIKKKADVGEEDTRDPDGLYDRLRKQTGLTLDDIFALNVKVLVQHRVVNQTRLGKIASVYALAICGNGDGRLGIGEAKGQEGEDTMTNAKIQAIKSMQPIPRYEERTIYGDVEAKLSAVEVKLMARPPGFGLRCQHLIFELARAAGIQDLSAKVPRSRNKMNTVKAAYAALMKQRIPDEIARGRGKKLVDVRKVYYGGRV